MESTGLVKYDLYKNEDGSIDWDAIRESEYRNGERCYRCDDHIISFNRENRVRQLCYSCADLKRSSEEVTHSSIVRCPHCVHSFPVVDDCGYPEVSGAYVEGEHDVRCPECDKEFEIVTEVSYSYISPMLEEKFEDEEEEEE